MNCPKCQTMMRERERETVVMDICPTCEGIWLDKGELEKLTQMESAYRRPVRPDDDDDDDDGRGGKRGRKGGFFSNIFDNFGD
ncbi:MAG: zf-TFIIB domain-containing protein [Fimbriimonadaceae bacterium]